MVNNDDLIRYKSILSGNLLNEKHYSGPVYHATLPRVALKILKDGEFKLRMTYSDFDDMAAYSDLIKKSGNKRYRWYLSVARGKINNFRANRVGNSNKLEANIGGVFVLDGSYFSNSKDYVMKPFDYFAKFNDRGIGFSEQEERVWSKKDFIPLDCVRELHIYSEGIPKDSGFTDDQGNLMGSRDETLNEIITLCKSYNIPFYYYDDLKAYTILDKRKAIITP